jgi:hypothetical protein
MDVEGHKLVASPCLCNALRQASRAVSRLYDEELRGVGLRTTQYSLLRYLKHCGEVRQRDLGALTSLDETTLTRNLRPLIDAGWVAVDAGEDRREKLVSLTVAEDRTPRSYCRVRFYLDRMPASNCSIRRRNSSGIGTFLCSG